MAVGQHGQRGLSVQREDTVLEDRPLEAGPATTHLLGMVVMNALVLVLRRGTVLPLNRAALVSLKKKLFNHFFLHCNAVKNNNISNTNNNVTIFASFFFDLKNNFSFSWLS